MKNIIILLIAFISLSSFIKSNNELAASSINTGYESNPYQFEDCSMTVQWNYFTNKLEIKITKYPDYRNDIQTIITISGRVFGTNSDYNETFLNHGEDFITNLPIGDFTVTIQRRNDVKEVFISTLI